MHSDLSTKLWLHSTTNLFFAPPQSQLREIKSPKISFRIPRSPLWVLFLSLCNSIPSYSGQKFQKSLLPVLLRFFLACPPPCRPNQSANNDNSKFFLPPSHTCPFFFVSLRFPQSEMGSLAQSGYFVLFAFPPPFLPTSFKRFMAC